MSYYMDIWCFILLGRTGVAWLRCWAVCAVELAAAGRLGCGWSLGHPLLPCLATARRRRNRGEHTFPNDVRAHDLAHVQADSRVYDANHANGQPARTDSLAYDMSGHKKRQTTLPVVPSGHMAAARAASSARERPHRPPGYPTFQHSGDACKSSGDAFAPPKEVLKMTGKFGERLLEVQDGNAGVGDVMHVFPPVWFQVSAGRSWSVTLPTCWSADHGPITSPTAASPLQRPQ